MLDRHHVQKVFAGGGVRHRYGGDHDGQQQPQGVGHHVPLTAFDLLRRVDALLGFPYVA
jgi:hypothetical protein